MRRPSTAKTSTRPSVAASASLRQEAVVALKLAPAEISPAIAESLKTSKAKLGFGANLCKPSALPRILEEADRAPLPAGGFLDRDICDIPPVTAFYNMTDRLALASDMQPNRECHRR